MTVRTRFSPSPTGMIHLGNARAALFSALFATKHSGTFILRIEDTDAARSEEQFVKSLQENLHWLEIYWQEGPDTDGEYGPYFQSQRQDLYAKYYEILEDKQLIYPCFCTDHELQLSRKLQLSRGQAPRYAGTCLKLSAAEIQAKISAGKKPAWRFSVPNNTTIEFTDLVKGLQQFQSNDISDFIVRRADGTAPFLFCNAIDDASMKVTHVLRGEDHLANTPRQILILRILGLTVPHYGHLSLIVGDDGAPLSKRHGSFSVQEMRSQGFLPVAIMNYLARLGHVVENNDSLNFVQLAEYFNLEKLSRSPARFDHIQLMHWQKLAVQTLTNADAWQWWGAEIQTLVPATQQQLFVETIKANVELPQDAIMWAKIFFNPTFKLDENVIQDIKLVGKEFFTRAIALVNTHGHENFEQVLLEMKQNLGIQGKKLFMPLRQALTGKEHGPELASIANLLGDQEVLNRLDRAAKLAVINRENPRS